VIANTGSTPFRPLISLLDCHPIGTLSRLRSRKPSPSAVRSIPTGNKRPNLRSNCPATKWAAAPFGHSTRRYRRNGTVKIYVAPFQGCCPRRPESCSIPRFAGAVLCDFNAREPDYVVQSGHHGAFDIKVGITRRRSPIIPERHILTVTRSAIPSRCDSQTFRTRATLGIGGTSRFSTAIHTRRIWQSSRTRRTPGAAFRTEMTGVHGKRSHACDCVRQSASAILRGLQ